MTSKKFRVRSNAADRFMTIDETTETFLDQFECFRVEDLGDELACYLYRQQEPKTIKVSKFPQNIPFLRFGQGRWLKRIIPDGVTRMDGDITEFGTYSKVVFDFRDIEHALKPPTGFDKSELEMFDRAHRNHFDEKDRQEAFYQPKTYSSSQTNAQNGTFQAALELINKSGFEVIDGQLTLQGKDGTQIVLSMKK